MNVAIVGAGPAGSAAAIALAQRGVRGVLLLDRARFPRDKTCGSGISPLGLRVLAELQLEDAVRRRGRLIHTLILTTPGHRVVRVSGGDAAAILLRKDFDQLMVDRACALGVQFRDGSAVTGLIEEHGRIAGVKIGEEEIRSRYVLCADGAHSSFSIDRRPRRTLATIMGWWENVQYDDGTLEMIFDRQLCPLYGWMFPETATRVNIGIVVDGARAGAGHDLGNLRHVFAKFLQRHFAGRLGSARQIGAWHGHPISYSAWTTAAARPGALYVGESARLTNAATGEGIYQAMRCGVLAAEAVARVVNDGLDEDRAWRDYTRRCRRTFMPGFLMGHAFRGAVRMGLLDLAAAAYARPRLRRMVNRAIGSALTG